MKALAVVLSEPSRLALEQVALSPADAASLIVDVSWSGISTGTERLLYSGRMPSFPGMGYPLVPGYETVGRVRTAPAGGTFKSGDLVFVPGANCYRDVRGLFGGASSCLVTAPDRVVKVDERLGADAVLLALAATAHHAVCRIPARTPELIVGHGVLGRLAARIALSRGESPPVVWETNPKRSDGAVGYDVMHPDADPRRDYRSILDLSGDSSLLDKLIARLALRGEIILGGFYESPLSFSFPPAFMREASIRIAAEWHRDDMAAAQALVHNGALRLDDLITHRSGAADARDAYRTAFDDPSCLKLVLDWSGTA